jgi:hypothetical protein
VITRGHKDASLCKYCQDGNHGGTCGGLNDGSCCICACHDEKQQPEYSCLPCARKGERAVKGRSWSTFGACPTCQDEGPLYEV